MSKNRRVAAFCAKYRHNRKAACGGKAIDQTEPMTVQLRSQRPNPGTLRRASGLLRAALLGPALILSACAPLDGARIATAQRDASPISAAMPAMNHFAAAQPLAPTKSNAQIAADFLALSFQMESGRAIDRLSRFEGPVTITVRPGAPATLGHDLDRLIARLRQEARIDIRRVTPNAAPAHITIETLSRARLQRVVPHAACFVVPRVNSWEAFRRARTRGDLDWTTLATRDQVAIFIPNDVAPQEIRDCLHEEVAQALGPLNDLYRLPDSVFNDDNFHSVLTGFDMLVLRVYYDPALHSGMTRAEAAAVVPQVLARLNPSGAGGVARPTQDSPRAWIDAIETALGAGTRDALRPAAAERAVRLAQAAGLSDGRLAFSHYALGRLTLAHDPDAAVQAFMTARRIYEEIAPGGVQGAHIDMQIAANALRLGQFEDALALSRSATPIAMQTENAALLSTLLLIQAEALDRLNRSAEARLLRLDSLGWGRYGFGTNSQMGARLSEIAALAR